MELNENITVYDLSHKLFINPPQDPCTFNIAPMNKLITSENHDIVMFPILMNIMIKGANILFGDSIMPHNMNDKQFNILKKYIASIGYMVQSSYTNNEDDVPMINIWFQKIKILTDCHGVKRII